MSALALGLVGTAAPATEPESQSGIVQRLLKAREDRAKHIVRAHLAAMDDARLLNLGFGGDDIVALRAGEMRLPR